MSESKYYWLLDAGHGGIDGKGKYVTSPSKMHTFEDGFTIYEGVINRGIQSYLVTSLINYGIQYEIIGHRIKDTPLSERVKQANNIASVIDNCIYVSIHCNAGGGSGNELYTSPGKTKSDIIGVYFAKYLIDSFLELEFRQDLTDGDADKENKFYVLQKTICPAVLLECGFMDNRKEAELLSSIEGQKRYAEAIYKAIRDIEKYCPI